MDTGQAAVAAVLRKMIYALVDQPEAVSIELVQHDTGVIFRVKAAPADRGKIIGKQGRTARSLRTLLSAMGMKCATPMGLNILEDEAA
jgi:uncharacterized protein